MWHQKILIWKQFQKVCVLTNYFIGCIWWELAWQYLLSIQMYTLVWRNLNHLFWIQEIFDNVECFCNYNIHFMIVVWGQVIFLIGCVVIKTNSQVGIHAGHMAKLSHRMKTWFELLWSKHISACFTFIRPTTLKKWWSKLSEKTLTDISLLWL